MTPRPKSEIIKATFTTRLSEDKIKAVKHLAVDEKKPVGDLLAEAIDLLLKKYGKGK
jgi:hypothetical protein